MLKRNDTKEVAVPPASLAEAIEAARADITKAADSASIDAIIGRVELLREEQEIRVDELCDEIGKHEFDADATRRNTLKAERAEIYDRLADLNDLIPAARRLGETRRREETATGMQAVQADCHAAVKRQASVIAKAAPLLVQLVKLAGDYETAARAFDDGNARLRASGFHDLAVRPVLHAVRQKPEEAILAPFAFLKEAGLIPRRAGQVGLIEIADRLKG